MEFTFREKIPEISFRLFSEIDPNRDLDSLECPICSEYYEPVSPKRPAICCENKHIACERCINNILEQQIKEDEFNFVPMSERRRAKCMFCRSEMLPQIVIDQVKAEMSLQLLKINKKLEQVSQQVKILIMKDCERKMRKQYESRLKSLEERENQMELNQHIMRTTIQTSLDKQRSLQTQLDNARLRIEELEKQNAALSSKVNQQSLSEIKSGRPVQIVGPKRRRFRRQIYNYNVCFNEFIFSPYKNKDFMLNFQERRVNDKYVIALKKSRVAQLTHQQKKKVVVHKQFFNYSNEEDRLLCFRLRNANPKALRYSFGLMDQNYEPIKGTSVSLYLNLLCVKEPFYEQMEGTIMFYVDLISRKMYIEAGMASNKDNIKSSISIEKFTVYIYFLDSLSQYELSSQEQK